MTYERNDSLAIRVSLELVLALETIFQLQVVIDLSVDGKDDLPVIAYERLCASI